MRTKDIKADGRTRYAFQERDDYSQQRRGRPVVVHETGIRRLVSVTPFRSGLGDRADGVLVEFVDGERTYGLLQSRDTRAVPETGPGLGGYARFPALPEGQYIVPASTIADTWERHEAEWERIRRAQADATARARAARQKREEDAQTATVAHNDLEAEGKTQLATQITNELDELLREYLEETGEKLTDVVEEALLDYLRLRDKIVPIKRRKT